MAQKPSRRSKNRTLYFAYGSNLNIRQMLARCPDARPIRRCVLRGYRLMFKGVADIVPAPGSAVQGALYTVSDRDLVALDRYEGFRQRDPKLGLYRREHFLVDLGSGAESAMFYAMNRGIETAPCDGYLSTIQRGFADWRLDQSYLDDAVARAIESDTERRSAEAVVGYRGFSEDDEALGNFWLLDEGEETEPEPEDVPRAFKPYDPFERWYAPIAGGSE